ncbi:hypothetical protein PMIN01_11934 [Paraphaeosphaeria minitans]|uniref:Uncharacterized protein n=1 Tax=Paraphaeosphaeria minitans TaxID=565426 RepID=A0A9P6G4S0_9PLEO|nr:hypothetical protein PMIN01_13548 [Paraphaeosphaeria minitans]KAF9730001.1 hypothetical protein PMIN01_11934 [Paraphaeosphaeria minitans]
MSRSHFTTIPDRLHEHSRERSHPNVTLTRWHSNKQCSREPAPRQKAATALGG